MPTNSVIKNDKPNETCSIYSIIRKNVNNLLHFFVEVEFFVKLMTKTTTFFVVFIAMKWHEIEFNGLGMLSTEKSYVMKNILRPRVRRKRVSTTKTASFCLQLRYFHSNFISIFCQLMCRSKWNPRKSGSYGFGRCELYICQIVLLLSLQIIELGFCRSYCIITRVKSPCHSAAVAECVSEFSYLNAMHVV